MISITNDVKNNYENVERELLISGRISKIKQYSKLSIFIQGNK